MKHTITALALVLLSAGVLQAQAKTTDTKMPAAAQTQVIGLGGVGFGIATDIPVSIIPRKPSFWARFAPRPAGPGDESISLNGTIGATVNETVPIPGTDMIRAGQVQEGAYSQNNNRSGTGETRQQSGVPPTSATILVKVTRP